MESLNLRNDEISSKIFSSKFRSKAECYKFLAIEAGAYLPHQNNITLYFMKDLISGKKKVSFYRIYDLDISVYS
jgi:hypothetical protein